MKKILLILLYSMPLTSFACETGMNKVELGYGASGCSDQNGLRVIFGSLTQCPNGFTRNVDSHNHPICTNSDFDAYDLSNGCPSNFYKSTDDYGRFMCVDMSGKRIVELKH